MHAFARPAVMAGDIATGIGVVVADAITLGCQRLFGPAHHQRGAGRAVRVTPARVWTPKSGFHVEIVCSLDPSGSGSLVDAAGFQVTVENGRLKMHVVNSAGAVQTFDAYGAPAFPTNRWVTLSIFYDGGTRIQYKYDDTIVSDVPNLAVQPMQDATRIFVGNKHSLDAAWLGSIDGVKLWRFDPTWVDPVFVSRPIDPDAVDCWKRWSDALGSALAEDTECAARVRDLINAAVAILIARAAATSASSSVWQDGVKDYRERWLKGDFDGVASALTGVISAIGGDMQLKSDPALAALANDPCVQKIAGKLPKLDCDGAFIDVLGKTVQAIEALP